MEIFFDSTILDCKNPFGAVSTEQEIFFKIFCKDGVFVRKASIEFFNEETEGAVMYPLDYICKRGNESEFLACVKLAKAGLYWYKFVFETENGIVVKNDDGKDYQLTVFDSQYSTPDSFKGGVIYHIFVDRFNKSADKNAVFDKKGVLKPWDFPLTIVDADGVYRANDFYGGNFQGIIDKLDYLADLGVTILYLSPIFKSSSNHRYDTGDYFEVDPLLGDEAKFVELIKKADRHGMQIMLDGVFNHTGADSRYFNKFNAYNTVGAYQSKESEYYDWYTFYDFPRDYHCWWGVTVCPTIASGADGFRKMIAGKDGVIEKWLKLGVKAWRLDVVDELTEEFVKEIRQAVKGVSDDNLLLGEVWEDASNKVSYGYRRHYFQGQELDGVMNYPFKEAILGYVMGGNAQFFEKQVKKIVENYPKESLDTTMTLIDSHDTIRAMTLFGVGGGSSMSKQEKRDFLMTDQQYEYAKKLMKLASVLQYIVPGMPSIYYGDEGGIQGFEDPMNRLPMPWESLDGDLIEHYKSLGKIRKDNINAICGKFKVASDGDNLLVIRRYSDDEEILCIANNADVIKRYYLEFPSINLLTNSLIESGWINLQESSAIVIKKGFR